MQFREAPFFYVSQYKNYNIGEFEKMGVYSTIAVVISLLYFMKSRPDLQNVKYKQGYDMSLKPTNFHETKSNTRPDGGKYYLPSFNVYYN
jgi:hypothetical protein